MNEFQLRIYLEEIDKHACWALEAYDRAENKEASAADIFSAAHQMLGHAGIVSRMLWPEEMFVPKADRRHLGQNCKRARERAVMLRERLGVDEHSPLNQPDLRLHVTRFEEKLDSWIQEALDDIIMPSTPPDNLKGQKRGLVAEDVFRHFNGATGEFNFRETAFQLQSLAEALTELRLRVDLSLPEEWNAA